MRKKFITFSNPWQQGEQKAQDDINAGRIKSVKNIDAYLKEIRRQRAKRSLSP